MMISPFSLEGEEVFACDGKEIRIGQTRGSASAGVVSEMINVDININIVLMAMIMMAMVMIGTCEIVGGICRSLVGSSQRTLRPAIRN